jgi:putative Mn2+ efflux pump MntP
MIIFVIKNILLGVGLAMDAFSVSIVNGLSDPDMSRKRQCGIAGTYAFFQFAMPVIGWFCVHTIANSFKEFQKFIPWIALTLLLFLGGKMVVEGIGNKLFEKEEEKEEKIAKLGLDVLFVQGLATSIDALSVGFTISNYNIASALLSAIIIAITTCIICIVGLIFGRKLGEKIADNATIMGGVILIGIGVEIFITGIF